MSCNLRAFSSLTAKRRYTLKSPALAFLKLNMYERDFGHLIDHEANRNSGDENIFAEGVGGRATIYHDYKVT